MKLCKIFNFSFFLNRCLYIDTKFKNVSFLLENLAFKTMCIDSRFSYKCIIGNVANTLRDVIRQNPL